MYIFGSGTFLTSLWTSALTNEFLKYISCSVSGHKSVTCIIILIELAKYIKSECQFASYNVKLSLSIIFFHGELMTSQNIYVLTSCVFRPYLV